MSFNRSPANLVCRRPRRIRPGVIHPRLQSRTAPCQGRKWKRSAATANHLTTALQDYALLSKVAEDALSLPGDDLSRQSPAIVNPRVRRRDRDSSFLRSMGLAPSSATSKAKQEQKAAVPKPAAASAPVKEEPTAATTAKSAPEAAKATAAAAPAKKSAPALKRGGSSNAGIMAAFSKATTKAAAKKESTPQPAAAAPAVEDHAMSDDGEDDSELPPPKPRAVSGRKSKREREEELRRMMEEDEEDEEEDAKSRAESPDEPAEDPVEEQPAAEPAKEEPAEVVSTSGDGRRRGKRKVMRKKQIMDDQGYLGMLLLMLGHVKPGCMLTLCSPSHDPGTRVGILLGGRGTTGSQAQGGEGGAVCASRQGQKRRGQGPGQHHVFFLQEMRGGKQLLLGPSRWAMDDGGVGH